MSTSPHKEGNSTAAVKRHFERKRIFLANIKHQRKCRDCGFDNPFALDFHHVDPSTKDHRLKHSHRSGGRSVAWLPWDDLMIEIEKCAVLCANCHRIEEASMNGHTADNWMVPKKP